MSYVSYILQGVKAAAIGLRAHSGWAALVIVSGSLDDIEIVDRRRIELCDPQIPGSKQPFHAAEPLSFLQAERWIAACMESSRSLALAALQRAVHFAGREGREVSGCGIVMASGRALPELSKVLSSHALIHTAEGGMYRDVLVHAAHGCGLRVTGVREKELFAQASERLGAGGQMLQKRLTEIGKRVGPPWTQDQKSAALVGLMSLSAA